VIKYTIIITLFFKTFGCLAQGVGDSLSQFNFAKSLSELGLYQASANELERLVYHHPNNTQYFFELLKAHKFAGNSALIRDKIANYPIKDFKIVFQLYQSYVRTDDITNARYVLESQLKSLTSQDQFNNVSVGQLLLEYKPKSAQSIIFQEKDIDLRLQNLVVLHKEETKKSAVFAGILSAIIPTAGRHYARDHKDAIFSLLFMGTSGFQAYRRFKNNGIGSPSGWAYATIFGGFYTANIYGSVIAAKRYNKQKYQKIYDGTKSYFDLYYTDY
jgi:hypothetical protein